MTTYTQAQMDAAMAQARDAALRESAEKAERWFGTPDADDIARILHAEILDLRDKPAPELTIAPLVWKEGGFEHDADFVDTTYTYQIQEGNFWYGCEVSAHVCGTNEAAKAAAQAHHEARLRALVLQPTPSDGD